MATVTSTVTGTWKAENLKIKPCILVTDKLNVARGVSYHRTDIFAEDQPDGSHIAKWETERQFKDKEEAKVADQVYSKARWKIRTMCLYTEVGYLCSAGNEAALKQAIKDARDMCETFNKGAKYCHIEFRVVCTKIEPENNDGVDALKEALAMHTANIRQALQGFDYKKARDLLQATKPAIEMLTGPEKDKLMQVREEARALATEIAGVVKEFESDVENALVSPAGKSILKRAKAKWNF